MSKQILQNLKEGHTEVAEVPCPRVGRGALLLRTSCWLVSAGTERMLLDFGKAKLIDKARQQPDKVRQVLDKVKTDGLVPTLEAVRNELEQPLALGCRVLGIDLDPGKLATVRQFGAETVDLPVVEDPVATARAFSRGRGVDAVPITASSKSSDPVHQAALMCRKRVRIVLVGVVGLELSRADFYEKELTFQVSCSSGPGRYDSAYEEVGQGLPGRVCALDRAA